MKAITLKRAIIFGYHSPAADKTFRKRILRYLLNKFGSPGKIHTNGMKLFTLVI